MGQRYIYIYFIEISVIIYFQGCLFSVEFLVELILSLTHKPEFFTHPSRPWQESLETYLVASHLPWTEGGSILVIGFVIWTKELSTCLPNCQAILNLVGQLNSSRKSCKIRSSNWGKIGPQGR